MAPTNPTESPLLHSATMSLDGFIAGVVGDMSWFGEHLGEPTPEIAASGGYVNVLGADVAARCLRAGPLDEGPRRTWRSPMTTAVETERVAASPDPDGQPS